MFTKNDRWHPSTKYIFSQMQTLTHKFWVFFYINRICIMLYKRAIVHDLSKLLEPEASAFANAPMLKGIEFGSPAYKASTEQLRPCLEHHYANNSHHFQYYEDKFKGMNALDRIEMAADWTASARRTKNGDVYKSLEKQQSRAGYTNSDKQWLKLLIDKMKG